MPILKKETKVHLELCLTVYRGRGTNGTGGPKYFATDFSHSFVSALEQIQLKYTHLSNGSLVCGLKSTTQTPWSLKCLQGHQSSIQILVFSIHITVFYLLGDTLHHQCQFECIKRQILIYSHFRQIRCSR